MSTGSLGDAEVSHVARSGGSQLLAMLGQGVLPLARILVARLFGGAAYGLYRASLDVCELCTRAGTVAADKGLLRFVAAHRSADESDLETRSLGSALRLAAGVGLGLAAALLLLAPHLGILCAVTDATGAAARCLWSEPPLPALVRVMALAAPAAGLVVVLMAATLAARVTRVNLLVRGVAEPVLLVAVALAAWAMGGTVQGLGTAHLLATLALLALAVAGARAVFGPGRLRAALGAPPHPTLVRFVLPAGGAEILNTLVQKVDVFILAAHAGAMTVGVYAAAEELGRSIAGVRYAFDAVASPMLAEAFHANDRARARASLTVITRWVATAAAPIAATVLALRSELLALYGPGFVTGIDAAALLVLGHLVNGVLGLVAAVVMMSGRSGPFLWNNLVAAAVNLTLSVWLVPRHGMVGAAVASLAGTSVLLGAFCVEAWRLERIHPFNAGFAKPFVAAAAAFGVEILVRRAPWPLLPRLVAVLLGGLVAYLGALRALGPGAEEMQVARRLVARLRRPGPPGRGSP